MFMSSGPVELLFLACFMANFTSVSVTIMYVEGSFLVCLSIFLLIRFVLWLMVCVNCLLKSIAFSLFVIAVVFLKVIVVF